jgi:hypothetical protein
MCEEKKTNRAELTLKKLKNKSDVNEKYYF